MFLGLAVLMNKIKFKSRKLKRFHSYPTVSDGETEMPFNFFLMRQQPEVYVGQPSKGLAAELNISLSKGKICNSQTADTQSDIYI